MDNNLFFRNLKGFDPESLVMDESFNTDIRRKTGSSPEPRAAAAMNAEIAHSEEISSIKTGGAIHSGCIVLPDITGKEIFAAANIKGEIYYFQQGLNSIHAVSRVSLNDAFYVSPVYSRGIIYCASRDGIVYAVETSSGEPDGVTGMIRNRIAWRRKMKKSIFAEPVIENNMLFITTTDGIYALNTDARDEQGNTALSWAISINGILSTPAVDDGLIFTGSEDKRFFCFDFSGVNPKKVWECNIDAPCRMKPCVLNIRDAVTAVTVHGTVYAMDKVSGNFLWSFPVKSPVIGNMAKAVINGSEYLFFGTDAGVFYCMDSSGGILWDFNSGARLRSEAAVSESRVYFGSEEGTLYCLDVVTGRELLRHKTGGNIYGRPLISGNRVYFGSTDGCIYSAGI